MEHRTVRLTHDHLERQARCSPERAIEETIWNALDAGGLDAPADPWREAIEHRPFGAEHPSGLLLSARATGCPGFGRDTAARTLPAGRRVRAKAMPGFKSQTKVRAHPYLASFLRGHGGIRDVRKVI